MVRIGASKHVSHDNAIFKTYTSSKDSKILHGDSHTTNMMGVGEVQLKFTSAPMVILKNVLHAPYIRKNLVSAYLINKADFKQVIKVDQLVLAK